MPWRSTACQTPGFGSKGLQFGHGCDAVEMYGSEENHFRICAGFNSATAVMPWRSGEMTPEAAERLKLQFGHGCDAVEIMPYR